MTENPNTPPALDEPVLLELQSINRKLNSLDEDVNRIDRDLATDRRDIEDLKTNIATLNRKMDGIMEVLTRFQVKTKDAVKDAVSEANSPLERQMKQFVNKKVVRVKVPTEKLTTRLLRWLGIGGEKI